MAGCVGARRHQLCTPESVTRGRLAPERPRDRRDTRQRPGGRSVWRQCGKKPRQKNTKLCRNERGQLVGVLTERDVVTKVAATPLDVDHVPLQEVMQPDPECLHLDDALVYAFHQMQRGAYRHVPVVDEQRRPTALVSMQAILDELVAALPQELLNLPPSPAHTIAPTPEGA